MLKGDVNLPTNQPDPDFALMTVIFMSFEPSEQNTILPTFTFQTSAFKPKVHLAVYRDIFCIFVVSFVDINNKLHAKVAISME